MSDHQLSEQESGLLMGETSVSLSLTSVMAMVSFLFIGLLLQTDEQTRLALRLPLIYLFIASFAFLYGTIIYANVSGNIARLKADMAIRQLSCGNVVSEFFGIYFIVYAMPLVVTGYIDDYYFSVIILAIDLIGFWFYHQLGFSILERYIPNKAIFYGFLATLCLLLILNFFSFMHDQINIIIISSLLLIVLTSAIGIYSICKKESC